jgi:hypothetical protein
MPVKPEMVIESLKELNDKVRLMGDGKFEPIHWAGDPILSKILTDLSLIKEIEFQGVMISMKSMIGMMFRKKEGEDVSEAVKTMSSESACGVALVFLAGYRLGRKDAEVDQLERML